MAFSPAVGCGVDKKALAAALRDERKPARDEWYYRRGGRITDARLASVR